MVAVIDALERQAITDEADLRLLPVAYWVLGGTSAFIALYGLVYVAMGAVFAFLPWESPSTYSTTVEGPPAVFGWFFIAIGLGFMLAGGAVATLQILTGFWIRKRRLRVACLVMAGISCMFVPFGTLIGVFTFLTLLRPSVAALFDTPTQAPGQVVVQPPAPSQGPQGADPGDSGGV